MIQIKGIIPLLLLITVNASNNDGDYENDDAIYRDCNHRSTFTDEELEIARQYFIRRFANATIPPQREPCQQIRVRRDFKCMTHNERMRWINVFRQLYSNNVLAHITEVHERYWASWHKGHEAFPIHFLIGNIVEREMRKIDPEITMTYWDPYNEGTAPERSIIWDYFGRAGNEDNNYCIRGGCFDDIILPRQQRCVQRQWINDKIIPRFYSPEYYTAHLQNRNYTSYLFEFFSNHFKPHMFIGGFNGDMAVKTGTNDPIFHVWHQQVFMNYLQRVLQRDEDLVPVILDGFGHYDYNNGVLGPANMATDRIVYFTNYTVAELYQYGYGEMCSFRDKEIEWALVLSNVSRRRDPPIAVQRLREALPPEVLQEWFPAFVNDDFSVLDIDLFEVGDRNRGPNCRKLPRTERYNDTPNGRRHFAALSLDAGIDIGPAMLEGEERANRFYDVITSYPYCSPYA